MRFRAGIIVAAIFTVVATPAFAQVRGSVKGGLNLTLTSFEEDDEKFETDVKTGLIIGAALDVPISPMFSFQPEFLYTMKGGKGGPLGTEDVKLNLDMIQVPVLVKLQATTGRVRPFLLLGPGFGFVTRAKVDDGTDEEDIKDDVNTAEVSGIVGGGLRIGRAIVEGRYDYGFNDLDKDSESKAKSRTFSILFGVSFGGN